MSALGLTPRAACERSGRPRLDQIVELVLCCAASVHDFSRFDGRFNIPFEFGLAYGEQEAHPERRGCFVFASSQRMIDRSLSDLRAIDVHIHHGSRASLFGELANAFVRTGRKPTVRQMESIYQGLRARLPELMKKSGAKSVFRPRIFNELVVLARRLSDSLVA